MGINAAGAVPVPLTVYGSWVTEVSPNAVPENISPDCGDVAFAPGSVGSRPALQRCLASPFAAGGPNDYVPTIVGMYSYTLPTGQIQNLYFDSNGILWIEYFSITPGAYTQLFQSTPGSYAKFTGTFGRVYIAISDGLHGAEVPLQWDGTYLDRVTQNGPAMPPTVTSVALPAVNMAASGNTLTRIANQVLAATATPHGLNVGYQAQIANVPDSNSTTVNQTKTSPAPGSQTGTGPYWSWDGNEWRTDVFSGTTPLSAWVCSGFNFSIPSNATILGVQIDFNSAAQGTSTSTVAAVALWNSSGQIGTAKTPSSAIPSFPTIGNFPNGGAGDLWGGSLTPSIVNDPSFGFAVSIALGNRVFLYIPYQMTVYYTLSGSGTVAIISSIVINNEVAPGLALVTTTQPHGLAPQEDISIVGVEPAVVANVSGAQWSAGVTTITTVASHNLTPGSVIQNNGITTSTGSTTFSFNGTFTVEKVPSPNQVTYNQTPITATDPDVIDATTNTGTISVAWPIPDDTPTPTYFEVDSCPTTTTFYVQVTYADGTWTTGTVGFIWEGTFFVTTIPSATTFTYFQPGPNGSTSAIGTVTPFGQCAPGLHLCAMCGITRQGAITAPGPFTTFIANGGQYVSVSNILPGPSNWVGRILIFTGAQPDVPGELPPFFYIPVPAMLEGQVVSTATQIDDNTTTSVLLDFSDDTLYAAIGVSIAGNNIANQIVLDGALGFGAYLSRLTTWGQRNTIQNLLNMGFDADAAGVTAPQGWTITGNGGTVLALAGRPAGGQWEFSNTNIATTLSQSAYQDCYGDPIFTGNLTYKIRVWLQPSFVGAGGPNFVATLSSVSTSFSATATILNSAMNANGSFLEATFSAATPLNIPSDFTFSVANSVTGIAYTLTVDELWPIPTETPYTDQLANASYVKNPEGFDGTTGEFGADDPSKLMDMEILRSSLYLLTQAPTGRLHETSGSATNEPSGWEIDEVAANCGVLSAFGLTHSQADDTAASGGDEWMAWPSEGAAIIFGGGQAEKISQEIQPNWYDPTRPNNGLQINMAASLTAWGVNDPVQRLLMFGLPIGTATAPNRIYVLNYRNLGSAQSIANSPPFHPSFAGKLIATDNSRKWGPWHIQANCAARMYRAAGALSLVLGGGNGQTPGVTGGYGNVYTLNPAKFTDDDFGQIYPYYTTYFFIDPEKAMALQLKGQRLLLAYLMAYIQPQAGDVNSQVTATYYPDDLANPWPLSTTRVLTPGFYKDRQFGGGMCTGERIAIKISSSPIAGTDNSFVMSRLTAFLRDAKLIMSGVNK